MRPPVERIKFFSSPYCRRLFFVGGMAVAPDRTTHLVFGKGSTKKEALERLGGEAAERASALAAEQNEIWEAEDPLTGKVHRIVPQDAFGPNWRPNSHGCAAHNLYQTAQTLAAFELFERHSVESWWSGDNKARRVQMLGRHGEALAEQITTLRAGAPVPRRTELFAIGSSAGIFTIAALSSDADGHQMAIAFAAHYDWTQAALRAVREVMSVELETADLVHARLAELEIKEGSNQALVRDRQNVVHQRYELELADADPIDLSKIRTPWPSSLDGLLRSSAEDGISLLFVDMTLDAIGVPVSRAIFREPPHVPLQKTDSDILPL